MFLTLSNRLMLLSRFIKRLPYTLLVAPLKLVYRVKVEGLENWPKSEEPSLFIANHTSFLDVIICMAFFPENIIFAIDIADSKLWWIRPFLRFSPILPIDFSNSLAIRNLIDSLKENRKVMIFPKCHFKIYKSPGFIANKAGAKILPVRIDGLHYALPLRLKRKIPFPLFQRINLTFLPAVRFNPPAHLDGRRRHHYFGVQLHNLMSAMMFDSSPMEMTLLQALELAQKAYGKNHHIIKDQQGVSLNYGQFLTRIYILSHHLKGYIHESERAIGILLPNSAATATAFFAIQALGRISALLNFTAGIQSVKAACEMTPLKTVLTSKKFIEAADLFLMVQELQEFGVRVLFLEEMSTSLTLKSKLYGILSNYLPFRSLFLEPKTTPDNAAVVLFTSGSEGTPKGVALSHKNFLANLYQVSTFIDFGPEDCIFDCLPMFHAFGLTGACLLPLLSGIKVFFYPSPLHYRVIPELIYEHNATVLFGTDTFLSGYGRYSPSYNFSSLRYVFSGAERLREETRLLWMEKYGIQICEGYGLTEASPGISVNSHTRYRAGTVGRIAPGIEVFLKTLPEFKVGKELCVKGPNIMLGYLKKEEPGVIQPLETEWYETGDIVSIDPDGFMTIQGRIKRFAKIGGEMISLAAVELVIQRLWPNHNHAIVAAPDAKKGERLILVTDYHDADSSKLAPYFRTQGLTELSVPRNIVKVDAIPLFVTGKVDYIATKKIALGESTAPSIAPLILEPA
jgi:acyl-[acyl-carrier-protein]-phospholipid O-acyltransferase/long-chain-fatty-acid--[acyl-carrier-protein] ligase